MVTKLVHDITQAGFEVRFNSDFEGMVTITYTEEYGDYLRHEHLSYPGAKPEELEKAVISSLDHFLEEVKAGKIQKDGLAKKT